MGQTGTTARNNVGHATWMLHSIVVGLGLAASACGMDDDEQLSQIESYATVSSYQTSTCSTAVVVGLSKQISDEIG